MDNVLTCLVSDRIEPGGLGHELAVRAAVYLGLEGGVCYSSYFSALAVAVDALALEPGDRVIISALSPALYLAVLSAKGLVPLVADITPDSGTLSSASAEQLMKHGPKALLLHYTLGYIPDLDALAGLGLPIIEDLSQGLGGNLGTRRCGSYGELTVIALDSSNIVTAGAGGIVLARDRRVLRALRSHATGNSNLLADLNASLALAQLRDIEKFVSARNDIAQAFSRNLMKSRHKTLLQDREADNVYFSFPVVLSSGMREARQYARRHDVDTEPAFEHSVASTAGDEFDCSHARRITARCLLFPLYPMLGKKNAETIARVLASLP